MASPAVFSHQVQVPWYDSAEWKFVYHEIFDDSTNIQRRQNALNILNIWKVRMPRLFSGVDGTLIILSAILEVHKDFPDEIVRQVQASAVMRFLNICVANQSKGTQETLFQTARNKKLPDWLVNLRHDFAHAQRIPSKDMLNRALEFSLEWLKTNYWDPQYFQLKDYSSNNLESSQTMENFVNLYGEIILHSGNNNTEVLKQKFTKRLKKYNVNFQVNLNAVLGQLTKSQMNAKNMRYCKLADTILTNGAIFNCIGDSDEEIPANMISLWLPMFGMLHYFNQLLSFISLLVDICCSNENENRSHKAALWLAAISKTLLGTQRQYIIKVEDKHFDRKFQYMVTKIASRCNTYMSIYMENLMKAAKCKSNFVDDVCQSIKAFNADSEDTYSNSNDRNSEIIFTLENVCKILDCNLLDETTLVSGTTNSRWELIDDMSTLADIPFGQSLDQNYHPVLSHFKNS